jgi:hypothetical protein
MRQRQTLPELTAPRIAKYRQKPVTFFEEQYICHNAHTGKDELVKLEDWQKEILDGVFAIDPKTGRRKHTMAVISLAKKNSKSELGAMIATWFAVCDGLNGEIVIAANDLEQASTITFTRIARAIRLNPVLARECKVGKREIQFRRTGTVIRAIARDTPGAAGNMANCTVFDELWGLRDRGFFDELTQNPVRKDPMTVITTYAGYDRDSLLYEIYQKGKAGDDPRMFFHWLEGEEAANPASWVTREYLDQQRRRLPPQVFKRLHCNQWSTPDEPFVAAWQIERCTTGVRNAEGARPEFVYALACDLGLTKDRAAVAVLHRDYRQGKVVLDDLEVWEGSRQRPVRIADVARGLEERYRRFRPRWVVMDPWEMRAFIQAHSHWPITEFSFSGRPMYQMATMLYNAIADEQLVLYPEAGKFIGRDGLAHDLQGELASLVLVETPSGIKFDHRSGKHNDMSIAEGMGLWKLMERPDGEPRWRQMLRAELALCGKGALSPNAQWARYARAAGHRSVEVDGVRVDLNIGIVTPRRR